MNQPDIRLYAILDQDAQNSKNLISQAWHAVQGGCTLLQYRNKTGKTRLMIMEARAIIEAVQVPLLINDRVDVALASKAHGVHLGADDLTPQDARDILGPDAIIGLTVKNTHDVDAAIDAPINYACIGGVFATSSKQNSDPPVGLAGLAELVHHIKKAKPNLPIGAIAGIGFDQIPSVIGAGTDGVALISALFSASDITQNAKNLRHAIDQALSARGHSGDHA